MVHLKRTSFYLGRPAHVTKIHATKNKKPIRQELVAVKSSKVREDVPVSTQNHRWSIVRLTWQKY